MNIFNIFLWRRWRFRLVFSVPLANLILTLSLGMFYLRSLAAVERYYFETSGMALALPETGLASYQHFLAVILLFILVTAVINIVYIKVIFSPLNQIISVAKDISSGNLSERIEPGSDDEIGLLSRVINSMLDSIIALNRKMGEEKSLAYMGTMTAGIAHEIRNPIASIKTLVELVETAPQGDDKKTEYFQAIHGEVDKLDRLIRKLFTFSKPAESNPIRLQPNGLLEELCREVSNNLKFNRVNIIKELSPEVPTVIIDKDELRQLLYNLVINAIEAAQYGGEITIASRRAAAPLPFQRLSGEPFSQEGTGGFAEIAIKDNGCGFDINNFEDLFSPFHTTKEGSTGLGLAIVKKIVEKYNGKIGASSRIGEGSTFYLYLPIEKKAENGYLQ